MLTNSVVINNIATISRLESNLLRIDYVKNCHVDLPQLEEVMKGYKKIAGDKPFYLLTIIPFGVTVSLEARLQWRKPERSRFKLAEAMVLTDNLAHRLMYNFTMRVFPPKHKIRLFYSEKEGLKWLKNCMSFGY